MAATIAYSIIAGRQLSKMSGQLGIMSETYLEIQKQTNAAQWSEYMACLNAQATQAMFIQAQNGASDSHAVAAAAVQQAAAEIESERAVVALLPRIPNPNEIGSMLGIPYSVSNDGKSAALDLEIRSRAILLRKNQVLHIRTDDETVSTKYLHAGTTIPDTPKPPYRPVIASIIVQDFKGQEIPIRSQDAQDFLNTGDAMVVVFGQMKYSDFAGVHKVKFCTSLLTMRPGSWRTNSPNEVACYKYNERSDDIQASRRLVHP